MRKRIILAAAAVALIGAAALPALSQTPLPEDLLDRRDARRVESMEKVVRELRSIVYQLRDTGKPVVVQPADTDTRMAEMAVKLGDLEQALKNLNGTLEVTTRDLGATRRENAALKSQVQALTDRLGAAEKQMAEAQAAAAPTETAAAAPSVAPTGDPAQAFTKARQLMLSGDYDAAEQAFASYVQSWPDAPKTQEANYWWGKTLTVRGAHTDAARAYISAIRGWPQTTWGPDAVVELGRSLVALKKPTDACQIVAELPRRYPKAPANITARATAVKTQAKCAA